LRNQTPLSYFRALSAIPRVSGNEKAAADYVQSVAEMHGCTVLRDPMHNLIVKKPATPGCEAAPAFMLQGHLDMVGEAAPGVCHDFAVDPIRLVEDGTILRADGTTLGADDGIAVALMLAVLTDDTLTHPALECVFTVQEETGLYGAMALDTSALQARTMLNLDAGPEGIFVATCAGGCRVELNGSIAWEPAAQPMWMLEITGLRGGHSGSAISKQGGNALVIAGLLLDALQQKGARPGRVWAGDKDNVIPASASAEFAFESDPAEVLQPLVAEICQTWKSSDPELSIVWKQTAASRVLCQESADLLVDLLLNLPHGVVSYSTAMEGLVETSANLAVAKTHEDSLEIHLSLRSAADLRKMQLIRRVQRLAARMGLTCRLSGVYPGWNYAVESPLRDNAIAAYRTVYGSEPKVQGIHAGLECGVLKGAMPDLDIIATGPLYGDMHTPNEWLDIPSIDRTYAFVKELLRRYAQQVC